MKEVKYGEDNYGFRISGTDTLVEGNLKVTGKIIGGNDMVGLYRVCAVDTKKNKEMGYERVVAKTSDKAILKAQKKLDLDVDNDDITFWTNLIFEWESKRPKEVKIVKE